MAQVDVVPERKPRSEAEKYAIVATGVMVAVGHLLLGISMFSLGFEDGLSWWGAPVMFFGALAWPVVTWRHLRDDPSRSPLVRRVETVGTYLSPLLGLVVLALGVYSVDLIPGLP